jgi:hypothetical protein
MKTMKQLSLITLITLIISSCATTANYTEIVKSWQGSDINRLISSWGPPSDVYTMPNGNKMYTWLYTNNSLVTTNYNQWLNRLETRQVQYWCKTTFTANKNDIIIDWRWEGNACRSVKK